jgi:predicted tellurium resistance membrane protein TerC
MFESLIALLALSAMEIVLGIDNLVFISILTNKLPLQKQSAGRRIGLVLALVMRLLLLSTIYFISQETRPLMTLSEHLDVSGFQSYFMIEVEDDPEPVPAEPTQSANPTPDHAPLPSSLPPAHGTSAHGASAHGTSAHGTSAHGTSAHGTSAHGTSAHGTSAHGTSAHGTSVHGTSVHGSPRTRERLNHHAWREFDQVSWRDLVLLAGGLFLLIKSVREIHSEMEGHALEHDVQMRQPSFGSVITQIAIMDIIFSLDSVITAVAMARDLWVMVAAVILAVTVMILFANQVGEFVNSNPTIKMLALNFLLIIGIMLVAEGIGTPISKGYIYFAMGFSLLVEFLNMRVRTAQSGPGVLA